MIPSVSLLWFAIDAASFSGFVPVASKGLDEVKDLCARRVCLLLVDLGRDDAGVFHAPVVENAMVLADRAVINIGRIEGVRFYLKEHELDDNIDDKTSAPPQSQDEMPMVEETTVFNSTGLTLEQNLRPASSNQRVIRAIEEILKRHKGKKSERTIVGYCMIAIRGLVKDETSDKILTAAFKNDYFPEDDIDKFSASVYRVLRAFSKKGSRMVHNPDEQWGEQKEAILQEVKTQIKKAISSI